MVKVTQLMKLELRLNLPLVQSYAGLGSGAYPIAPENQGPLIATVILMPPATKQRRRCSLQRPSSIRWGLRDDPDNTAHYTDEECESLVGEKPLSWKDKSKVGVGEHF